MDQFEGLIPEGFVIRTAVLEDAPAINALIQANEIVLQGAAYHSEVELLQEWQRPDFHLDADAWVILAPNPAEPQSSLIVGYQELWNQSEHAILSADGYVHPGYNDWQIGVVLLRLAERRARQHISLAPPGRRVAIRSGVDSLNTAACKLLEDEGYHPVETIWHMEVEFMLYEKELRPGGYTWRPATRDDGPAINRLLLDIEAVDRRNWLDTLDERERDFADSSTNIETDTILAITPDDQIAGLGWIFAPPEADQEYITFLWGEVHPAHRGRGLGHSILSWLENRGRQILASRPANLPHCLRTSCKEKLTDRTALFQAHGFEAVRSYYRMRRDLKQPIADPMAPESILIERWQTELDLEALQVLNTAFKDHWGSIPTTQEIWRLFLTGHPDFRADLSFMAFAPDIDGGKKLIGVSLNKVHAAENLAFHIKEGWIQELAVLREWRRQGIATALLRASMLAFRADGLEYAGLGVDTENLTGALRIYERDGFYPVERNLTFSKTV